MRMQRPIPFRLECTLIIIFAFGVALLIVEDLTKISIFTPLALAFMGLPFGIYYYGVFWYERKNSDWAGLILLGAVIGFIVGFVTSYSV